VNEPDRSNIGHRRAALALHRLHEQDRQWLLGRLPEAERGEVIAMLAELDRMSLRAETADVEAVLAAKAEADAAPAEDDPWRALDRADAGAVLQALREEPDQVIAVVCSLRKWRWLTELLDLLGEGRAASVARLMRGEPAPAPAVRDAVAAAVTARVVAGQPPNGFEGSLEAAVRSGRAVNGKHSWKRLLGWRP
jgi:hypothetical protein